MCNHLGVTWLQKGCLTVDYEELVTNIVSTGKPRLASWQWVWGSTTVYFLSDASALAATYRLQFTMPSCHLNIPYSELIDGGQLGW